MARGPTPGVGVARKRGGNCGDPQRRQIGRRAEEPPEAEAQLGDHLAVRLGHALASSATAGNVSTSMALALQCSVKTPEPSLLRQTAGVTSFGAATRRYGELGRHAGATAPSRPAPLHQPPREAVTPRSGFIGWRASPLEEAGQPCGGTPAGSPVATSGGGPGNVQRTSSANSRNWNARM